MLAGAVISAAVAVVISYPTLRLRGPFFALATIAILEVVRLLVIHEESWTGGSSGISLPLNIGWTWIVFREKANYVLIAFALFALVTWVSWYMRKSRIGHYLIAIREREDAALAVGIHTVRMKIIAAVVSAMLTSIVGAFHITYLTFVDPSSAFSLELSVQVAMFALIGGLGTVAGPIAGTFLVLPIAELARGWLSSVGNGMHGLIYGLILVAVVLTIPRGLAGAFGPMIERWLARLPYLGAPRRPPAAAAGAAGGTGGRRPAGAQGRQAVQELRRPARHQRRIADAEPERDPGHDRPQRRGQDHGVQPAVRLPVAGPGLGVHAERARRVGQLQDAGCVRPPGLGRTFQIAKPFTGLTVLENIMLGAFIRTSSRDEAEQIAPGWPSRPT